MRNSAAKASFTTLFDVKKIARGKASTALLLSMIMPLLGACAGLGGDRSISGFELSSRSQGPVQLRSAPLPSYVFDYHDSGDAALNQALIERRFGTQFGFASSGHVPTISSGPRGVSSPEEAIGRFSPEPDFKSSSKAKTPAKVSEHTPSDISFVKVGGGSDYADWQACERQLGGAFVDVGGRYALSPQFEHCMRQKGYKPESEILADFESGQYAP